MGLEIAKINKYNNINKTQSRKKKPHFAQLKFNQNMAYLSSLDAKSYPNYSIIIVVFIIFFSPQSI